MRKMKNFIIHHHVKGMMKFCQWIRILPINSEQVNETRKFIPGDFRQKSHPKFNIESYTFFKYSKLQFFLNLVIMIFIASLSGLSLAFMFNLANSWTQTIGAVGMVLTQWILPIGTSFFCNKNASKVKFKKYIFMIHNFIRVLK